MSLERRCYECKEVKPRSCFNGPQMLCRPCKARAHKIVRRIKKHAPPKPRAGAPCQLCQRATELWNCDHDHATGKFRGWICRGCNVGLGYFKDDIATLARAITYLETSRPHLRVTQSFTVTSGTTLPLGRGTAVGPA